MTNSTLANPKLSRKLKAADFVRCMSATIFLAPLAWLCSKLLCHRILVSHEHVGTIVFTVLALGNVVRYSLRSWRQTGLFLMAMMMFPAALDHRCLLLASGAIPIATALALDRWISRRWYVIVPASLLAAALAVLSASAILTHEFSPPDVLLSNAWDVQWSMSGEEERLTQARKVWESAIAQANVKELEQKASHKLEAIRATEQQAREKEHQDYFQDAIGLYKQAVIQLVRTRIDLLSAASEADRRGDKPTELANALDDLLNMQPGQPEALQLQRKLLEYLNIRTLDIGQHLSMNLALIPAGKFTMGSPGSADGEIQHEVTISRRFYMSVTPVTQAQWEAVMGNNPSNFKGDELPVEQVSWDDAVSFCRKLSEKTGKRVRLPTEAEWEYACRAGTTTAYYGGDDVAWYDGNSGGTTHAVGQKKPNAWRLYDMHGNVWQWCQDWYGQYPQVDVTDPMGPASGTSRILRGGSWGDDQQACRSACRYRGAPDHRSGYVGFRVCLDFR